MPHPKDRLYAHLFARIDASIKNGYFLESSWIAYAIIEDRIDSILKKFNKDRDPKVRLISNKLDMLSRIQSPLVRAQFAPELINRIGVWTSRRNNLTHEMANAHFTYQQITVRSKQVALEGELLAHDVSNAAMRTKSLLKRKAGTIWPSAQAYRSSRAYSLPLIWLHVAAAYPRTVRRLH